MITIADFFSFSLSRNRFKAFETCLGYCDEAVKSTSTGSSEADNFKITQPFQVPEPLLPPKPGSEDDASNPIDDVNSPLYDADYDADKCTVNYQIISINHVLNKISPSFTTFLGGTRNMPYCTVSLWSKTLPR